MPFAEDCARLTEEERRRILDILGPSAAKGSGDAGPSHEDVLKNLIPHAPIRTVEDYHEIMTAEWNKTRG